MNAMDSTEEIFEISEVRAFCTDDWRLGLRLEFGQAECIQAVFSAEGLAALERIICDYRSLEAERAR